MSARPKGRWLRIAVAVFALGGALALVAPAALGMQTLRADATADVPASAAALEARWDAILDGAVDDGVVDYGRLAERRDDLDRFVATLADFGPSTAPAAFAHEDARFAYYLNAYNALVVFAVLELDVRETVHEVHGPIEPVAGMGFFWAKRFVLDGQTLSLYTLEHDVLRAHFDDARLHAAIVCASESCPPLREGAYHAATLDAELDAAAARFTAPPYVRAEPAEERLVISAIYDWYEDDFGDVLDWIARHAEDPAPIERARREGWTVTHADYDWSLNGHR